VNSRATIGSLARKNKKIVMMTWIKKEKKYFVFAKLAVAAVCKSKVISLVANIHASARAMCVEYNGCVLVAF
jgi:hypothetical protein